MAMGWSQGDVRLWPHQAGRNRRPLRQGLAATQSHPEAETITVAFRGIRAALYLAKDLIRQGRYSPKLLGHSHHSVFEPVTVLPDGES